ncbi:MAG: EAL domain-containing protein [Gammaproteobacteria bacterium]|nr:EAL domain-containing protein [Gammaproteobacteria bacterium]MDH5630459.1 EAL domain-containing protein [Gammaproteobacteria bacterium]
MNLMQKSEINSNDDESSVQEQARILIVDDDVDILDSLQGILEIEFSDCTIETVNSFDKALDLAKDFEPDIALLDIKIGKDNGLELISKLKVIRSDVICIMMTAFRETEYAVTAVKNGANDYLFKPVQPDELFNIVKRNLEKLEEQRKVIASEQRVKTAFNHIDDLLFVVNTDGEVIEANDTATKNISEDKVLKKRVWELPWWDDTTENKAKVKESFEQSLSGQIINFEIGSISLSDSLSYYSLSFKPVYDIKDQVVMLVLEGSDVTREKVEQQNIEYLAFYDSLTGLANRRMFMMTFEQNLATSLRHKINSALLFLDLDYFKQINDELGHGAGDSLLKQVAERLASYTRQEDIVARLGGDEFVVLLPLLSRNASTAISKAKYVAEKICKGLNEPYDLNGHLNRVGVSVGVVIFPEMGTAIKPLMEAADAATYKSKESGRNRVTIYNGDDGELDHKTNIVGMDINEAIEKKRFKLFYQPIYGRDEKIYAVEALLRWEHPELGLITASDFFNTVESHENVADLCYWTIKQACRDYKKYGKPELQLAINVNSNQFHNNDFVKKILEILEAEKVAPENIILEIDQRVLSSNPIEAKHRVNHLIGKGISFALDGFGEQNDSISHLLHLPISYIKLGWQIIQTSQGSQNNKFLDALIAMSQVLKFNIVAKHVESEEMYQNLVKKELYGYQGYYLKSAVMLDEID